MSKTRKLTTALFAKLCGTGKDTLLHYDETGVLSPAFRGENGYRYYHIQQVEVFNVVWMLKELGMPLREVSRYLSERSPERFENLLDMQAEQIDRKIARLEAARDYIGAKRKITEEARAVDPADRSVRRVQIPDRIVLSAPVTGDKRDESVSESVLSLYEICEKNLFFPHFLGGSVPVKNAEQGQFLEYSELYCTVPRSYPNAKLLPGGDFLAVYADGYDRLPDAYARLFEYARTNKLRFASDFYEDTLLDELSVKGYDNYLLKLYVRIQPE